MNTSNTKDEQTKRIARCRRRAGFGPVGTGLFAAMCLFLSVMSFRPCKAGSTPSQSDVFKSIQDSMGQSQEMDYRPLMLIAAGGGVAILLLLLTNRLRNNIRSPQVVNSPGKLMKEVLKAIPLKSVEVKQLRLLAELIESPTSQETNPLVLLLCPSLMAKGLQAAGAKADRKAIAQIVRKLRNGQQA